jgi:CheY-like chemotaxis protein/HPt (histidine-containing phosphotransfer) domain-containing protein
MSEKIRTKRLLDEVLGDIQHLKKEKKSQIKYLKLISDSGIQISEMIESSLDMFRMEEKTYEFTPCPCDLVAIFQKLSADLNSLARQKNLNLEFYIIDQPMNDSLSYWVLGEYRLLQNLFANLIKNAIEASPINKQIRIDIDNQDARSAMIQIHNLGVVPESIRDRFFDRYTTSGKKSGTGLGTYSAKLITRTHQGKIWFETDETMGTILFVTLPTTQKPEDDSDKTEKKSFQLSIKGTILIADDNLINQQVLKGLLEDFPIILDLVENGQEAVEMVMAGKYDLILMDMEMPVMDGREAIKRIRQHFSHKELPVIVLTAHNLEIEDFNHTDQIINDIIIKPIQPEILFNTLQKYLSSDVAEIADVANNDTKKDTTREGQQKIENQEILNIDLALKQLMGKRYLLDNVMQSFRKDHFNAYEIVKQLLESNQLADAQRKVHSIKGLAGTIGAQSLQRTAQELETAIKNEMESTFKRLLISFRKRLEPVINQIDKILPDQNINDNKEADLSNDLTDQLNHLEKRLNNLYELLIDCDSEANDACEECLHALDYLTQNTEDRSLIDQLKHCLKNYLFDDAALTLEKICEKLGLKINQPN